MATKTKYTKEVLLPAVENAETMVDVLTYLGLSKGCGNRQTVKKWCSFHEIDLSHLGGRSWSKGRTQESSSKVRKGVTSRKILDEEVFKLNGHPLSSEKLKKRLLQEGWKNECKECGLTEWLGKPIALHLDHINGNPCDNRKENLRILCPNCHQQTDTWGNRKRAGDVMAAVARLECAAEMRGGSSPPSPTTKTEDP